MRKAQNQINKIKNLVESLQSQGIHVQLCKKPNILHFDDCVEKWKHHQNGR
jgi:uncharacterized protein YcgL (UPF0745 family)